VASTKAPSAAWTRRSRSDLLRSRLARVRQAELQVIVSFRLLRKCLPQTGQTSNRPRMPPEGFSVRGVAEVAGEGWGAV
jgi:hypothetical protein